MRIADLQAVRTRLNIAPLEARIESGGKLLIHRTITQKDNALDSCEILRYDSLCLSSPKRTRMDRKKRIWLSSRLRRSDSLRQIRFPIPPQPQKKLRRKLRMRNMTQRIIRPMDFLKQCLAALQILLENRKRLFRNNIQTHRKILRPTDEGIADHVKHTGTAVILLADFIQQGKAIGTRLLLR